MPSIALFSIIPLLHHSLAQTWFAMVEFNWLQSRHMSAMTQCDSQVAPGQALTQTWFYWPQFYSVFFSQTTTPSGSSVQVAPGQAIPPEKLWDDRQSS
jgi:hypothetical protein